MSKCLSIRLLAPTGLVLIILQSKSDTLQTDVFIGFIITAVSAVKLEFIKYLLSVYFSLLK